MTNSIVWFRKGLRVHDNYALEAASKLSKHVYPIFILDPWFIRSGRVGVNRLRFLLECLSDLDKSLRKMNSRLIVLQGNPFDVLPNIFKEWKVDELHYEWDSEPYAKERDSKIEEIARQAGVRVHSVSGHTLHNLDKLLEYSGGKPPLTYQGFLKIMEKVGVPKAALPTPSAIPAPGTPEDEKQSVPTMEGIGYEEVPATERPPFRGGESVALERLEAYMKNKSLVAKFEKPNTAPTAFNPPSTTVLSPYLKFGCLSPRLFYWRLHDVYRHFSSHSQPPVSLLGQLYWREFFYLVGHATPNFDKMVGNPICRQVPWDNNPEYLAAWADARTGYPWIDAAMTQLRQHGWLHHLARHAVACFLTRGDLWITWEKGAEVFDRLLLDADWSLNNANWMWLSCSAFFSQFFRVYSPVAFAKKTDPDGKYIKQFLPVLRKFPAKYIYEPWTAPLSVQQAAGCIIGKDYPEPIVDHAVISKKNIARMKAAFDANKLQARKGEEDEEEEEAAGSTAKKTVRRGTTSNASTVSSKKSKTSKS